MISDNLTTFCSALALNTGGVAGYALGETIDMGNLRDIGQGTMLYLVISVAATCTSAGSATAQFALVSDAVDPILPASATVHMETPVFAVAALSAGTNLITVAIPWEGPTYERYVGIRQTTGGAAFTGGTINAFLTPTPQSNRAYADYSTAT